MQQAATPPRPASPSALADYATRVGFVVELAEHLHAYGTTAQRLEGAVVAVAITIISGSASKMV